MDKKLLLKEYCKRTAVLMFGLIICGIGNALGVVAGVAGTNGWNTLAIGLSDSIGINFGASTSIISAAILLIAFLIRGKIGIGTLCNAFLIPVFSQIFLNTVPVGPASNQIIGTLVSVLGQFTFSVGSVYYMRASMGCGPRDTLMVVAGAKMPKVPIGAVKFLIEVLALLAGILLGASVGFGTLLTMVFQASIFQIVCMVMKFEPRNIVHENLVDTYKRIRKG